MSLYRSLSVAAVIFMVAGVQIIDLDGWRGFLGAGLVGLAVSCAISAAVERADQERRAAMEKWRLSMVESLRSRGARR